MQSDFQSPLWQKALNVRFTTLLANSLVVGCLTFVPTAGIGQTAREDVPQEYIEMENLTPPLDEKDVSYLARKYKASCVRCHGVDGAGGDEKQQLKDFPPRNFTDAAFMKTRSDGQLFYQILKGGGERSAMPAMGPGSDAGWPEERIWKMVRYVRRFAETGPDETDLDKTDLDKTDKTDLDKTSQESN
jgi:mono/diheme cytochrome c family protein